MNSTKEIVQDIKRVVKRRKVLLIITPLLFVGLSYASLQFIEPKYESSTSILVQKEETLNPLMIYQMAINIAQEDRMKSFNEIIYSRSTMELMIDSLGLDSGIQTEAQKQNLIRGLRQHIVTTSRATDSFEITYHDTDPIRARDGVQLLADHFISTRLRLENRRNNETVEFFQEKLDELEQVVDMQREQIVSTTTSQMKETPIASAALQVQLQEIDTQLEVIDWEIMQKEINRDHVAAFLDQSTEFNTGHLFRLPLDEIPFGAELSTLLGEYDELRQQFTDSYPRLRALKAQITEVANRIMPVMESNLNIATLKREDLVKQRQNVLTNMEKAFIATQQNNSNQSDFSIYQELYNEMKVKLEQARMTRDIGTKATEQFLVLDAPYIPEEPSSPNKKLVLIAGLILGIIISGLLTALAEILDLSIRSEEDIEIQKPIIAYLGEGTI
ncbi:GumC family protein [Fodinibius sp. AD559]|uniref:GumC family protein n=1 Tax=Fodinibius sp. AD559 TaxID=3424179 RepID=UPI004046DB0B